MASSPVEFASCLLNRPSKPPTSTSYKKNIKGYLHSCITTTNSENSWLPSSESGNSKTQNNVDLSWLPNYNDERFPTRTDNSNNQHAQNVFDDSWLPNYNDTKRKSSTTASNSNNSNRSRKTEKESDDSWLPSTPIVKNENKNKENHSHDSWLPNYKKNSSTTSSKSNNSNRSRKAETDPDHSWLPSTPIVNNGDKKKESSSSCSNNNNNNNYYRKKSSNHNPWERAREVAAISGDRQIQQAHVLNKKPESSRSQGKVAPCLSESSVETDSLGGVSTLLRRWKDAETRNTNRQSKPSSGSNNNNHTGISSEVFDGSERCASPSTTDESFVDLESCKSSPSIPLSYLISSRGTNVLKAVEVEKEKIRVGDIINKLSKEDQLAAVSQAARNKNESFAEEKKCFSPVIGKSHLIRGRQAFIDFLNLKEQDKLHELENLTHRKPVSKFPNRGRLQAMLRVRAIRLGAEPKTEAKSRKLSVSKTMKTIWDKFSTGVKQGASVSRKVNNNGDETKKNHASPECSVYRCQVREVEVTAAATTTTAATNSQELESMTACNQSAQAAKDHQEITESTLDNGQDMDSLSHSIKTKQDTHSEILVPNTADYHEKAEFFSAKTFEEKELDDSIQLQRDMGLENCHNWISEYSQSHSDWDEEEEEHYYNQDWISDIARPRSDWECMRQKRYQEMLHLYSYNQDIQQLLQRKSVSSFLSSDQRNMLDQLMVSQAQGVSRTESRKEEEKYEEDEFIDQTTCSSTPTQSPALEQESRSNHHPNAIYDAHQMASLSPSPSLCPNHYLQDNNTTPHSSSIINQSSIEMELIYDLRGHMEQVHQEVMELRKAVTSCVNMQVKMQRQSVQNNRSVQVSAKCNCCVCYAMQANSFLYRCGHMCTCYDCGLELQCTSGKCPICEAQIVDVVKAYGYGN